MRVAGDGLEGVENVVEPHLPQAEEQASGVVQHDAGLFALMHELGDEFTHAFVARVKNRGVMVVADVLVFHHVLEIADDGGGPQIVAASGDEGLVHVQGDGEGALHAIQARGAAGRSGRRGGPGHGLGDEGFAAADIGQAVDDVGQAGMGHAGISGRLVAGRAGGTAVPGVGVRTMRGNRGVREGDAGAGGGQSSGGGQVAVFGVIQHHAPGAAAPGERAQGAFLPLNPGDRNPGGVAVVEQGKHLVFKGVVEGFEVELILAIPVGVLAALADGEAVLAVIGLRPPAVEDGEVEAGVDGDLLAAGAAGFQRARGLLSQTLTPWTRWRATFML